MEHKNYTIYIPENLNELFNELYKCEPPCSVFMNNEVHEFDRLSDLHEFTLGMEIMWDIITDKYHLVSRE